MSTKLHFLAHKTTIVLHFIALNCADRELTSEPKYVQKRRQYADNQGNCKGMSTFEKEIPKKKLKNVYFCKKIRGKNIAAVYFGK